jgi:long-chain acyl-CoA synthetase
MSILEILNKMQQRYDNPAVIFNNEIYTYNWLYERTYYYYDALNKQGIKSGHVVVLQTDYSPESLAIFLALIHLSAIVMPLTNVHIEKQKEYEQIVNPEFIISVDSHQQVNIHPTLLSSTHELITELRTREHPGLIILSSGSTGKSKAIVHDFSLLTKGISASKKRLKVISFLLFDHIGGINTVANALVSGNCLVIPKARTPEAIACCVQNNRVSVLITSPSFLNLMSISGVFEHHDLTCLKQINYGSEVMPQVLLEKLIAILPETRFNQAYGLSELGVVRTRTNNKKSNSFVIDDQNIQYRIRDGHLEIKSVSSMLGYLNAATPFTHDGWFMTGDMVEMIGNEIRIIGRNSEIINVGGEKVFPAEIENILLKLPEVEDVVVSGEKNLILGNIVVAKVKIKTDTTQSSFANNARKFCLNYLPAFKVPQKFLFVNNFSYGERFKKIRHKSQ